MLIEISNYEQNLYSQKEFQDFSPETKLILENMIFLEKVKNQVKLIEHSEKEYKELKKENRKLKKEISKFLRDVDIYDKLLSIMKTTMKKLISWVSSIFKVPEETLAIDFQTETNTHLDPFEQLLAEDEDIRKELEEEYLQ